jgi:hypothetical protein
MRVGTQQIDLEAGLAVERDWQGLRFLADAGHPLVRAGRRVARPSGPPALEAARVDIGSAAKERPEKRDLRLGRRVMVYHDLSCLLQADARKPILKPALHCGAGNTIFCQ